LFALKQLPFEGKLIQINFDPVGNVENVGQLAGLLGCGFGEVPLKYLGLPLGLLLSLNLCGRAWRI
jgi:hypothetical protein